MIRFAKSPLAAMLVVAVLCSTAWARVEVPAPGPPCDLSLPSVKPIILDNGLEAYLIEKPSCPVIYLQLVIRGGETASPPYLPGLATLASEVLKGGTVKRPGAQMVEEVDWMGASVEAMASDDYSAITCQFLPEHLDRVLAIVRDLTSDPVIPQETFEEMRNIKLQAVINERKKASYIASDRFFRSLYKDHPYAVSSATSDSSSTAVIPSDTLNRVQLKDLQGWLNAWYRPNNALLSLSGSFSSALAEKSVRLHLGEWKRGPVPSIAVKAAPDPEKTRIALIDIPKFAQCLVIAGKTIPPRSAPDYQSLVIANQVLAGDVGMRLNQATAQENLKAGALISSINSKKHSAYFMITGRVLPESTDRLISVILAQVRRLSQEEITYAEFERAKSFLYGNLPLQLDAAGADPQATLIMFSKIFDLPDNYWTTYNGKLQKQTRQDVQAACRKHLSADNFTVTVLGDGKKIAESLRAVAPVEIFSVDGKSRE
jgi:zinc protease